MMKLLIKSLFYLISWIYSALSGFRNFAFNHGWFKAVAVDVPVISVGNLTTGGTGKTPTVIAIAKALVAEGKSVAVLSRGYGRKTKGSVLVSDGQSNKRPSWISVGDEPLLISHALPKSPVIVDEDRVRGAQLLIERFHPDVLILDDAFQHRRIARDLDIVLLNARDRESFYRILPVGRLREKWSNIRRANLILVTKSNLYEFADTIRSRIETLSIPWFSVPLTHDEIIFFNEDVSDLDAIQLSQSGAVLLISGIGDPKGFEATVQALDIHYKTHLKFRDHQIFGEREMDRIYRQIKALNPVLILTTEKDAIRLESKLDSDLPVAYIRVKMELPDDAQKAILDRLGKAEVPAD